MKPLVLFTALLLAAPLAWSAESDGDGDYWYLQTSVITRHWSHDPEHNNHQDLIGLERNRADGWVWGGATFRNSFSQRSNYVYAGKRFDLIRRSTSRSPPARCRATTVSTATRSRSTTTAWRRR